MLFDIALAQATYFGSHLSRVPELSSKGPIIQAMSGIGPSVRLLGRSMATAAVGLLVHPQPLSHVATETVCQSTPGMPCTRMHTSG